MMKPDMPLPHPIAHARPVDGRDEMNLAEFPVASLRSRGDRRKAIGYEGWITDKDGTRRLQRWTVSGSTTAGLPTEFDERVYVALMFVSTRQGFTSRKVAFSVYRILKVMGEGTDKTHYQIVERSLDRLKGATIKAEGAFWDNEKKELVRTALAFSLIDEYWLRYKEKDARIREAKKVPAYIVWNERIWKSFKDNYIKHLDLGLFYSLKSPIARRLYRLLDKRMWKQDEYRFGVFDLASRLGMAHYRMPAHVRAKLKPGFDELIARGIIARVEFFKARGYPQVRFVRAPRLSHKPMPKLWQETLTVLQRRIPHATFQLWLARTKLVKIEDGVATIGVANALAAQWIAGHLVEPIRASLAVESGCTVDQLAFEVQTNG